MNLSSKIKGLIASILLLSQITGLGVAAASSPTISRSYSAKGNIQTGSLVSLTENHGSTVQMADTSNQSRLIGIEVAPNTSLIEVNNSTSSVQVATDGTANALVSTINGDIKVGDEVGVSPVSGVGMKVGPNGRVIGLAQSGFNSKSSGATREAISTSGGKTEYITVGFVPVTISVGTSNQGVQQQETGLQKIAQNILGKPISTTRLIISIIIAVIALAAIISLIYASVYSTIISIGRNPLAKYEVLRTLASVMGMVLIIGAISSLVIYLLLR